MTEHPKVQELIDAVGSSNIVVAISRLAVEGGLGDRWDWDGARTTGEWLNQNIPVLNRHLIAFRERKVGQP